MVDRTGTPNLLLVARLKRMAATWFVVGTLLLGVALPVSYVRRLPLTTTMLYLDTPSDRRRPEAAYPDLRSALVCSMTLAVTAIAVIGVYSPCLSWGAAVLLGAILAPTDPVLASDVQVEHPFDYPLRLSLTRGSRLQRRHSFAVRNACTRSGRPHNVGEFGLRIDVIGTIGGGLTIGALPGTGVARIVLYMRRVHREATGLDDFLCHGPDYPFTSRSER